MTKILLVRHGHVEGISPEYVHKRIRGDWALSPTRPATPKRWLGHRGAPPPGEVILGVRPESFPAARENAGNRIAAGEERAGRNF